MVKVVLPLDARLPTVQVTVPPLAVHPLGDETKLTPVGRGSLTLSALAVWLQLCRVLCVYVMVVPAMTVAGALLWIARSAEAVTVVVAVSVLRSEERRGGKEGSVAGLVSVVR